MHDENCFSTPHVDFAAFVAASRKLKYIDATTHGGRTFFTFDDPDHIGPQLEIEFHTGALVPAETYFTTLRHFFEVIRKHHCGGAR